MRYLLIFLLLSLPVFLPAQEALFARLAAEVCNCMERISVEPVRRQASNCLREVARSHEESLLRQFRLEADNSEHRALLAERLTDELVENCPILATIRVDETAEKRRWSDAVPKPFNAAPAYTSPKGAAADPPAEVISESPGRWQATGSVERLKGGAIVLQQPDASTLEFIFAPEFNRRPRVVTGQQLSLVYRREWRKEERRIVNLIVRLE